MGYGIIHCDKQKLRLVEMGVLKLNKLDNMAERLKKIYHRVQQLSIQYKPDACALEAPFFGKNVQSMLKLGRTQGVAMAAALHADIPLEEYSPKKVKQAVTGNGNASKEQVWLSLQRILHFKENPEYLDATDAVAVAVCHYFQMQSPMGNIKDKNSWQKFMKENPHRIK